MKIRIRDLHQGFKAPNSKLTIIGLDHKDKNSKKYFQCRCDCGNLTVVQGGHITSGNIISCGCSLRTKQGLSNTPEGRAIKGAIRRCYSPDYKSYHTYGERGLTVSERYKGYDGIKNLIDDIGRKPTPKHSLDRIDNDKGYEPGNLKWSTRREQDERRTNSRVIIYKGESLILERWAEKFGINSSTIRWRLENSWSVDRAFTTPVNKKTHQKVIKGEKL